MGTRSRIAVQRGVRFESIYCHWDGDLSGVGKTLLEHYTSETTRERLIKFGGVSDLTPAVTDLKQVGGEYEPAVISDSHDALVKLAHDCDAEYLYVWLGAWGYTHARYGTPPEQWPPLATLTPEAIAAE